MAVSLQGVKYVWNHRELTQVSPNPSLTHHNNRSHFLSRNPSIENSVCVCVVLYFLSGMVFTTDFHDFEASLILNRWTMTSIEILTRTLFRVDGKGNCAHAEQKSPILLFLCGRWSFVNRRKEENIYYGTSKNLQTTSRGPAQERDPFPLSLNIRVITALCFLLSPLGLSLANFLPPGFKIGSSPSRF